MKWFAAVACILGSPGVLRAQAPTIPASIPIVFSGEVRQRSDWDRPEGATSDLATYLRTRFGVLVSPAPNASLFLQLQDSRVLGAEANSTSNSPDIFDLHQGYLALSGSSHAGNLSVRAGRQEISFGNERLVGVSNWTNTGRSFDGIAGSLVARAAQTWSLTGFAATVEERGRRFAPATTAAPSPDHLTLGLFGSRPLPAGIIAEATLLADAGGHVRWYDHSNRTTVDSRWRIPNVAWMRWELEGAYQFGSQRYSPATGGATSQDVSAWLAAVRVGPATAASARFTTAIGADVLSGDGSPIDGRYSAFNTMFASNHQFYGLIDVLDPSTTHDAGLVDLLAMLNWRASASVLPRVEAHRFSRQQHGEGALGCEGDLVVPWRISGAASVEGGGALFRSGHDGTFAGLGPAGRFHDWVYLQLRVGF